jgi:F-type H+-transporting ATPase subunit b
MLIDWFTVAAQLINFLVLVWLLKRFLYKPILKAINEREQKIVMQLRDAEAKKTDAENERDDLRRKNIEFEQQRDELLNNAINEVKIEHQRLLYEARREVEDLRSRLHDSLRNEHLNLNQEIIRRAREEVFAITRKLLSDLASADLETQMTGVFISRLKELKEEEKKQLLTALSSSSQEVTLSSTFDLPIDQQQAIQQAIHDLFHTKAKLTFGIASHLTGGFELFTNEYKLSWNIEDYLVSLEESLSNLLNGKSEEKKEKNET